MRVGKILDITLVEYGLKTRSPISRNNREGTSENHDIKVTVSIKHDIDVVVRLYDSLQQGNSPQLPPLGKCRDFTLVNIFFTTFIW